MAIIAAVTDPTPAWPAIPRLPAVSARVPAYAAVKARGLEVTYSEWLLARRSENRLATGTHYACAE